jgi:hypothetical protein
MAGILEGALGLAGALSTMGLDSVLESGQVRVARLAHETYRNTKHGRKSRAWEDLTQNEQAEWVRAVGTVLDKETK